MSIRKNFAKATLKVDKALPNNINPIASAILMVVLFPVVILPVAWVTKGDDHGSQNEVQINQDYSNALSLIEQKKAEYDDSYGSTMTSEVANIINSAEKLDSESADTVETDENSRISPEDDWQEIVKLSDAFTKRLLEDEGLSETHARDLSERLEENVISFKDLGYQGLPDADNLRECQAVVDGATDINKCSRLDDRVDTEDILRATLLVSLAYPIVPLAIRYGVDKNREKLNKMAKGARKY